MTWINPTPVAVIIVPVIGKGRVGALIGKRGIYPKLGEWNLIAGFVDITDVSVEAAAVRELLEETGMVVRVESVKPIHTFCDGRVMLTFCYSDQFLTEKQLDGFIINNECPEIGVAWEPQSLCFDSHTRALARWFEEFCER